MRPNITIVIPIHTFHLMHIAAVLACREVLLRI